MTRPVLRRPPWLLPVAVALVLAVAIALRFIAFSALWLDEAQTVAIAHRTLPHLFDALRHDGSPPLYYVLLHGWMVVFGTGDVAVRSLSGVFSVLSLPLIWLAARRLGADRRLAWVAVLLLATSPFAIRYATETRMYSLVVALWLAAFLALARWYDDGPWWSALLGALLVAALVLTHYWSLFAIAVVGAGALVVGIRGDRRGWRLLAVLAIGCLGLAPWLSSFVYQLRHTGAPWGSPPSIGTAIGIPIGWAGVGPVGTEMVLALGYYALLVIAVVGVVHEDGLLLKRLRRRVPELLIGIAFATMLVGVIVSQIEGSAYALRYSAIAVAPFLLAVTWGVGVLRPPWRACAVTVAVVLGLVIGAGYPARTRTQAKEVADALKLAGPTDSVVFCPDQLGPAVHRLAPDAGRQLVYPTMGSPEIVNWVDYKARNEAANPEAFARAVVGRTPPTAAIWLVYAADYPTFGNACTDLLVDFSIARGQPEPIVTEKRAPVEQDTVVRFIPKT